MTMSKCNCFCGLSAKNSGSTRMLWMISIKVFSLTFSFSLIAGRDETIWRWEAVIVNINIELKMIVSCIFLWKFVLRLKYEFLNFFKKQKWKAIYYKIVSFIYVFVIRKVRHWKKKSIRIKLTLYNRKRSLW